MPKPLGRILFLLHITRSHGILRRYFVVNGFDGALAMLGLNMGFYVGGPVDPAVALTACLGTAIALGMSGLSSAYISEFAERRKWLRELEEAMVKDLTESAHGAAARVVPLLVAAVNGAAPLLIALFITIPWWLANVGMPLGLQTAESAIVLAFLAVFSLGVFLGQVSGTSWLWSGIKAALVALVTASLILLLRN
jgi:predicted membrane protein (TIGR00267 family)